MEELEVNRLQECEQKLVNQVNGLTKQMDRLGMEKESYKSQVDLLDDQLKKANSDKQALEDAYEVLLQEFLKTQNKWWKWENDEKLWKLWKNDEKWRKTCKKCKKLIFLKNELYKMDFIIWF